MLEDFELLGNQRSSEQLFSHLNKKRRKRWEETTFNMDFKHSSRKAWNLLKKLGTDCSKTSRTYPVTCDQIASRLLNVSKSAGLSRERKSFIKKELRRKKKSISANSNFSSDFSFEDFDLALHSLKTNKAAGIDGIFPKFLKHLGVCAENWLLALFNYILQTAHFPPLFKRVRVVAIAKPGKDGTDPSHFRPISLLSVVSKLFERLVLNRIEPKIDAFTPVNQAGFRKNRSCEDQVLALCSFIEYGF